MSNTRLSLLRQMQVTVNQLGLEILTRCEWLPPPFDAVRAAKALNTPHVSDIWNDTRHGPVESLLPVEQLATAFVLRRQSTGRSLPTPGVLSSFEHAGTMVSPDFAEKGALACHLLRTLVALHDGTPCDDLDVDVAATALGTLWESAFVAPSGFGHYITRTLMRRVPNGWGFLPGLEDDGSGRPGVDLAYGLDLLHTAIALHHQPHLRWPSDEPVHAQALAPKGAIESGRGRQRPRPLTVHVQHTPDIDATVRRTSLWFAYPDQEQPVAWIEATALSGQTGSADDMLDLVDATDGTISPEVRRQVRSVFANPDIVSMYARVRRLVDRSEHRVHRMLVIESMAVAPEWRGRAIGMRLVQQLLLEVGEVEIALGRPRLALPALLQDDMSIGVQAARALASVRQAHAWSAFGGEFLINGVMGLALPEVRIARTNALWDRQPQG